MKKILLKLTVFAIILLAFDWGYGRMCHYLVTHPRGGDLKLDQYICDSIKAEVLIFGSSKAKNQYDPEVIEENIGKSVFNCGTHGMGVIYNYGRWKIISQRYTPKVIVYEFLPIVDMMVRDDNTIFINHLRPYYGKVEGIDSIFWTVDHTEKYKMLSKTYRYHSILNYISCFRTTVWSKNGYDCPENSVLDPATVQYKVDYKVDSLKLYYMKRFISEVTSKCKLIMVVSPMYSFHEDYGGLTKLKQLCAEYNVPVLDHFCDTNYVDNPDLYIDMAHLNRDGSAKWSKQISMELRNHLKLK